MDKGRIDPQADLPRNFGSSSSVLGVVTVCPRGAEAYDVSQLDQASPIASDANLTESHANTWLYSAIPSMPSALALPHSCHALIKS